MKVHRHILTIGGVATILLAFLLAGPLGIFAGPLFFWMAISLGVLSLIFAAVIGQLSVTDKTRKIIQWVTLTPNILLIGYTVYILLKVEYEYYIEPKRFTIVVWDTPLGQELNTEKNGLVDFSFLNDTKDSIILAKIPYPFLNLSQSDTSLIEKATDDKGTKYYYGDNETVIIGDNYQPDNFLCKGQNFLYSIFFQERYSPFFTVIGKKNKFISQTDIDNRVNTLCDTITTTANNKLPQVAGRW